MSYKKQKLQLHQYEVNKDNVIDKELFVYSWPDKLIDYMLKSPKDKQLRHAVRNLSEIITLAIDDVVYTRNNIRRNQECLEDKFWVFSLSEINIEIVKSMVQEWLIAAKIKDLTINDLHIESPLKINTKQIFEKEYRTDLYGLIPQLYKNEFCKHRIEMSSLNNRYLDFYPVIDNKRESVAISNTFDYEFNKKTDVERYSYAISFSLVNNREFPDKLFLNVYTGIKVWACRPFINLEDSDNFISGKQSSSVFVYKENDYLHNKRKKLIGLMYTRDDDRHYKFSDISDSILAKLIKLDLRDALINPNNHNDFTTADVGEVILLTNNKVNEKVQYGAGLDERMDIFRAFGRLFPKLHCRELIGLARLKGNAVNKKRKALESIEGWNNRFDDYEYIDAKGDKLFYDNPPVFIPYEDKIFIEIYTNNERLVEAFIEFAVGILRLNMPLDKYTYRSCDGYEVEFIPKDAYIARGLSKKEQSNPRIRKDEIKKILASDRYNTEHVLSFIDIEPFHTLKKELKKQDPKKYIRSAFKDCGRVTQFINGFESEGQVDKIRLVNATYDLFSAAGFMDHDYFNHSFNDQILLGLSTCKNSRGQFIVLSKIENGQLSFKVCGLSDEDWQPLRKLLPKLQWYTLNNIANLKIDRSLFQQWITDQLNDLPDNSKEHLLYFDASLRSYYWPFAKNANLDVNDLRLVAPEKFKFIRINTTSEVPEYNIFENENDVVGINRRQGLFSNDYKVFYSVGAKPDTIRVKNDATKLDSPTKMIAKQRIVEFVILNDDLEENLLLANRTHALRKLNLTFDASTKYPLPLFINDRFGEYLDLY